MMNNIDPYDMLIELNERLLRVERAHNRLAKDYERTQQEFTQSLIAHQKTQQHLLNLQKVVHRYLLDKSDTTK